MKKIFLMAAAAATLGFTSCDINDVENIGEMSASVFPATEEDAEAVLAGVYEVLNETMADPQAASFLYYSCLASDDQLGGGGTNDKLMQAEDLLMNSEANMTGSCYTKHYMGISRANVLVDIFGKIPEKDLTEIQAQTLGEALALRAYYYYELASMYGNVPLVRNAEEADAKQGDVKLLWGQILEDLYTACRIMPRKTLHNGHVDVYTAEAMLGRAWLFYTGMYGNGEDIAALTSTTYNPLTQVELASEADGKKLILTKDMVVKMVEEAATQSGYSLVPDFRNLWAYTNKCTVKDYEYTKTAKDKDGNDVQLKWVEDDGGINPESMFAIKFNKFATWDPGNTIGFANGLALHFGARAKSSYEANFPFGQGWGAGPVAENLMLDWAGAEPNDMRRDATVQDWRQIPGYDDDDDFVQSTNFHGKKWCPITSFKDDGSCWCTFEQQMYKEPKWPDATIENFQLSNIHDLVLIRFADVLLMWSELTETVDGINQVRDRAGLPAINAYSLKALQDERRWELACEGVRWNDIRRWHIAASALEKQTNTNVSFCGVPGTNKKQGSGYSARYNATAGFAKMPEDQVELGVVKQNPGWEGSDATYGGWSN